MDETFNLECLKAHNELRVIHKASPLKLSKQLAEDSQASAEAIAKKLKRTRSRSNDIYGENVNYSDYLQTGEEITLKWYQEVNNYKFGQERQNLAMICHFAQIVWHDTSEVGFGRSKSENDHWITVARYKKPGNIVGKFKINVHNRVVAWDNYPIILKLKSITMADIPMTIKHYQNFPKMNLGQILQTINHQSTDQNQNENSGKRINKDEISYNSTISQRSRKSETSDNTNDPVEFFHEQNNVRYEMNKNSDYEDQSISSNDNQLSKMSNKNRSRNMSPYRVNGQDNLSVEEESNQIHSDRISTSSSEYRNFSNSKNENKIPSNNVEINDNSDFINEDENESPEHSYSNRSATRSISSLDRPDHDTKFPLPQMTENNKNFTKRNIDEIVANEETAQPRKIESDLESAELEEIDGYYETKPEYLKEFREQILMAHNKYRRLHNVRSLKFNENLTVAAQKWANHISRSNHLGYSNQIYKGMEVGENIVIQAKGSLSYSIKKMVENWYNEKENYHYGVEPENVDNIGHFSQVVWTATQEIGIGISSMSNYSVIVCFYYPPGNTKGEFLKNVLPISKK